MNEEERAAAAGQSDEGSANGRSGRNRRAASLLLRLTGDAVILIIVAICLSLFIPGIAGCRNYVVISGSMEPAIPVGSLVYSVKTDPAELVPGDVILFTTPERGETPVTHRVVSNDTAAGSIVTKGDANEHEDVEPVKYEDVRGKVIMHIPYLGRVVSAMTSGTGKIVTILLLMGAWMLGEAGRRLRR